MSDLADGRADCSHIPEAHVALTPRGYQSLAYCRCRKIFIRGKKPHGTLDGAEAAADMLLLMLKANQT
jgi:hypothetical protein